MDLSKWSDYTEAERRGFTIAIDRSIWTHVTPPAKYIWMHREARLSGLL
jgi:hypothetical protein